MNPIKAIFNFFKPKPRKFEDILRDAEDIKDWMDFRRKHGFHIMDRHYKQITDIITTCRQKLKNVKETK